MEDRSVKPPLNALSIQLHHIQSFLYAIKAWTFANFMLTFFDIGIDISPTFYTRYFAIFLGLL